MNSLRRSICTIATGALTVGAALGMGAMGATTANAVTSQSENVVERPAGTVTGDALPTVQIDQGVVWDQAIVGNTVYVGGTIINARPAGAAPNENVLVRRYLLAYDITTGEATNWAPMSNGSITAMALSPDKSRLYVGGRFTAIDGATRTRIAAFDTATGALIDNFAPVVDGEVSAIEATNDTVYMGGFFATVNGVSRTRLAAVDLQGNLTGWAPRANNYVRGLALTNDGSRLVVGGSFTSINGLSAYGMASLDPVTGRTQSWAASQVIRNGGSASGLYSVRNDGKNITIAAWGMAVNRGYEGIASLDQSTGKIRWMADCHGDSYDTTTMNGVVYAASHQHNCTNIGFQPETTPQTINRVGAFVDAATGVVGSNKQAGYINYQGQPSTSGVAFSPQLNMGTFTGMNQAAWSTASNDKYLVVGGEFTEVNGKRQQGLVRFAVDGIAPKKMGARFNDVTPQAVAEGTTVRLSWKGDVDWDGLRMTHTVHRVDASGKDVEVGQVTQDSTWWLRPQLALTDDTAVAGTAYTYYVRATDADGNISDSAKVSVTTQGVAPAAQVVAAEATPSSDATPAADATPSADATRAADATAETTAKTVVKDTFSATRTRWGAAETGGSYTYGTSSSFSTDGSLGVVSTAPAVTSRATLASVSATDSVTTIDYSLDSLPTAGSVFTRVESRVAGSNAYWAYVRTTSTGAQTLTIAKRVAGVQTDLKTVALPGTYAAGDVVRVQFDVTGADASSTLKATAWKAGETQPEAPQISISDATAELQAAGASGISTYLSGTATAPVKALFDNYTVTATK